MLQLLITVIDDELLKAVVLYEYNDPSISSPATVTSSLSIREKRHTQPQTDLGPSTQAPGRRLTHRGTRETVRGASERMEDTRARQHVKGEDLRLTKEHPTHGKERKQTHLPPKNQKEKTNRFIICRPSFQPSILRGNAGAQEGLPVCTDVCACVLVSFLFICLSGGYTSNYTSPVDNAGPAPRT